MEEVYSSRAPKPIGPYSQALKVGNLVFCSGQIGIDPSTGSISDEVTEQTKQILINIREILAAASLDLSKVVKTTIYLTDLKDFEKVNKVYETFFQKPYPSRTTVQVSSLPRNAKIEIEAIASYT